MLDNNYQESLLISPNREKKKKEQPCQELPGTILRIFIPAGAVINLLNLIEVSSPSGICIIVRIPILAKNASGDKGSLWGNLISAIESAGGTVEIMTD